MLNSFGATRTKRILIVEDDPVHRRLMENALQQRYELDFAPDSQSALAHLVEGRPSAYDLVVVDLRIPARMGEQATTEEGCKILRTLQKNGVLSPIVLVVSGNMIDRTRRQVEDLGVQKIFEKPFSLREFREFVDSLFSAAKDSGEATRTMRLGRL